MNVTAQAGDTLILPCGTPPQSPAECKRALRSALRQERKAISPQHRLRAARSTARRLLRCAAVRRARRVAVYLSMGSELPTAVLIATLRARRIIVFAPALLRGNMRFRILVDGQLQTHPLGMQQPRSGRALRASAMDVLIMPLLSFDSRGTRLGQGGGYYDRALSNRRFRPYRLGLAYAWQQQALLPRESWDQALNAVITECRVHRFPRI